VDGSTVDEGAAHFAVRVCKSDFVVTELLELIYVELLLSEFVREFTKK
jgi:hypothetical protein